MPRFRFYSNCPVCCDEDRYFLTSFVANNTKSKVIITKKISNVTLETLHEINSKVYFMASNYLCIETNTKYTMFGFESTPSKLSGSLAREARAKMKRVRNNCLTDSEKEQVARIPWHRTGQPREIGYLIGFLVDDKADYITGADFSIDGGLPLPAMFDNSSFPLPPPLPENLG